MDPVRPHQHVALGAAAPGDLRDDSAAALAGGHHPVPGAQPAGAQPLGERAVQHAEQPPAVDRVLGPPVAGGEATRFAPDSLPVLVEHDEFAGREPLSGQIPGQAQLAQLAHRVREHVDADPEILDLPSLHDPALTKG